MVKPKQTKDYHRKYILAYMTKRRKSKAFRKREWQLRKKRFKEHPEKYAKWRKSYKKWIKKNPETVKAYYVKYNKKRKRKAKQ